MIKNMMKILDFDLSDLMFCIALGLGSMLGFYESKMIIQTTWNIDMIAIFVCLINFTAMFLGLTLGYFSAFIYRLIRPKKSQ